MRGHHLFLTFHLSFTQFYNHKHKVKVPYFCALLDFHAKGKKQKC